MNFSRKTSIFPALALLLTATVVTPVLADGDDGYELKVDKGQVTVTARESWHINQDYPWKLVIGDVKLDKSKFALTEKTATVADAPKGTGKLKGAVCSKDVCKTVEKEVTIR